MSDSNAYDPNLNLSIPITIEQYRRMFPAFSNSTTYPDEMLAFWFGLAYNVLNRSAWGSWYNFGLSLFVSHQLALETGAAQAAARGGIPGMQSGAIASKSINGVSVSFDSSSGAVNGAGDWNMTTYGRRFIAIARMIGSQPMQVIGADAALSPLFNFGSTFTIATIGSWTPG